MRDRRPFVNDSRPGRYQSPWGEQRGTQYRALCADGIVRTATATAEADTFYTVPARVKVRGITVTGHVFARPGYEVEDNGGPVYAFSAYSYRKNAAVIVAAEGTVQS